MTVRSNRATAQRERVLAAAVEIFSKRGYRSASMNEIAASVGLSKPTLYHYFRRKEEILVQLYEDLMRESVTGARAIVAAASTPLEAIRRLIAFRVVATCERRQLHKVFFEEEEQLPADLVSTVIDRRREFEDILKSAVVAHMDATGVRLPTSATVYVNACLGAANWVYKWFDPYGSEDPNQLGEQIATLLVQPLLAGVAAGQQTTASSRGES